MVKQIRFITSFFGPVALSSSVAASLSRPKRPVHAHNGDDTFERLSRWPDDLKAMQQMKLGFFEHIAIRLRQELKALSLWVARTTPE